MIDIQIILTHGGSDVDITRSVISYDRELNICSGIGTLRIDISPSVDIELWDQMVLYEGGHKKNTFYALNFNRAVSGANSVTAQDSSIKLIEYFVTEDHFITGIHYSRTWIETFLEEAGVDYHFDTDSMGSILSENTNLGKASAYDIITQLLQMSGWYMYFNRDGQCRIGNLSKSTDSPAFTFRDNVITNISTNKNDKMARNRAVVWGNQSPQENRWIFADRSVETDWQTSPNDKRAVVVSNTAIRTISAANQLAERLLNEFSPLSYEKTITLAGEFDIDIGDVIAIISDYYHGEGLATTVASSLSSENGLSTIIVLDQRCPRLFGYYSYTGYVYIGTYGSGVWRKELDGDFWEPFSNGILDGDFIVSDLIIKRGIFASVCGNSLYVNISGTTSNWMKYSPPDFIDMLENTFVTSVDVKAVACDIDDYTNNILVGYTLVDSTAQVLGEQRAWIIEVTPGRVLVSIKQLTFGAGYQDFKLVDVDKTVKDKLATVEVPFNYASQDPQGLWGNRYTFMTHQPDGGAFTYGPLPTEEPIEDAFIQVGENSGDRTDLIIEGLAITSLSLANLKFWNFDADDNQSSLTVSLTSTHWGANYANKVIDLVLWRESSTDEDGNDVEDRDRNYHIMLYTRESLEDINPVLHHYKMTPLINEFPERLANVYVATTENIELTGTQTIDGMPVTMFGLRVLVKDQDNPIENGIYISNDVGAWTRATDLNISEEFVTGGCVYVPFGTENAGTTWQVDIEDLEDFTLGTDDINFFHVFNIEKLSDRYFVESALTSVDVVRPACLTNGHCYKYYTASQTTISPFPGGPTSTTYEWYITRLDVANDSFSQELLLTITMPMIGTTGVGNILTKSQTDLIPAGDGVALVLFLLNEENSERIGANVRMDVLYANPTEFGLKGLPVAWNVLKASDNEFYWGCRIYFTQLVYAGSKLNGSSVESYVKFKFSGETAIYRAWCAEKEGCCGSACWADYVESERDTTVGAIRLDTREIAFSNTFISGVRVMGGGCCHPVAFADGDANILIESQIDYDYVYGLSTRNVLPEYVYQNKIRRSGLFYSEVGTLNNGTGTTGRFVCTHVDDFDSGIYIVDYANTKMYKEGPTGGVIAEMRGLSYSYGELTLRHVFTNSYYIYQDPNWGQSPSVHKVLKLKKEYILNNCKLCLLVKSKEPYVKSYDHDFYDLQLENSKGFPLLSWSVGDVLLSGATYSGYDISGIYPRTHRIYSADFLARASILFSGTDMRVFDSTDTTLAGNIIEHGRFYEITTWQNNMTFFSEIENTDSTGMMILEIPPSGSSYRCEASNGIYPYFFVSTSGNPSSFYQMDPASLVFDEHSSSLPNHNITVIRLDDRI